MHTSEAAKLYAATLVSKMPSGTAGVVGWDRLVGTGVVVAKTTASAAATRRRLTSVMRAV